MAEAPQTPHRRARVAIPAVIAGGVSALLLAFSMTPTFAALSAAIQNTVDTAGTGTLIMQEVGPDGVIKCNSTDGGGISTNSATCATINKYGGNLGMVPGQTVTTNITIKNTGTVEAGSFSVKGGACTQANNGSTNGSATDLCSKYDIVIKSGSTTIYSDNALAFGTAPATAIVPSLIPAAGNATGTPISIAVTLNTSAGNTHQGLSIAQGITWTFGAGS